MLKINSITPIWELCYLDFHDPSFLIMFDHFILMILTCCDLLKNFVIKVNFFIYIGLLDKKFDDNCVSYGGRLELF